MNRTTILGRNIVNLSKSYGRAAPTSSLAAIGALPLYPLPPSLIPATNRLLQCDDLRVTSPLLTDPYELGKRGGETPIFWHVSDVSTRISRVDWHVPPQSLSPRRQIQEQTQLQNEVEQNPESAKPEKPKWEEEQYPDIGKSKYASQCTANDSH
jgi:hypothetical protein